MAHPYKDLFDKVNESRRRRGLLTLTWKQFITKEDPDMVKKYRQQFKDHIEPDAPKKFQRPLAEYSNQSIYDKYGV